MFKIRNESTAPKNTCNIKTCGVISLSAKACGESLEVIVITLEMQFHSGVTFHSLHICSVAHIQRNYRDATHIPNAIWSRWLKIRNESAAPRNSRNGETSTFISLSTKQEGESLRVYCNNIGNATLIRGLLFTHCAFTDIARTERNYRDATHIIKAISSRCLKIRKESAAPRNSRNGETGSFVCLSAIASGESLELIGCLKIRNKSAACRN